MLHNSGLFDIGKLNNNYISRVSTLPPLQFMIHVVLYILKVVPHTIFFNTVSTEVRLSEHRHQFNEKRNEKFHIIS